MTGPINIEMMDQSVEAECKDMPNDIGISIALWRLKELIKGYKYAVTQGYKVSVQEGHQS